MSFLKVGKEPTKSRRLYLMDITLPTGMRVIKIGVASGGSSKERMLQVCGGIYDKYRTTPSIHIKRDREVPGDKAFKYEATLHKFFSNVQYTPKYKFDGSTELFAAPIDDIVQAYELVIEGVVPDFKYELPREVDEEYGLPF